MMIADCIVELRALMALSVVMMLSPPPQTNSFGGILSIVFGYY
jgi:hypothetical protein